MARSESPFVEEWLEFHVRLGFDRVHLVSTDESESEMEDCLRSSVFRDHVALHHFDAFQPGWQMACYNAFLPRVEEDWLLVLDVDEYLCLGEGKDLRSFLDALPGDIGQVQFPWLNAVSDSYFHASTFDVLRDSRQHVSNHVKSLVRRRNVTHLGIHGHAIRGGRNVSSALVEAPAHNTHEFAFRNPEYYRAHPFVLHFASRGHFDVFNRIIDHRFFNTKNGSTERRRLRDFLTREPTWENLPTRCLLAQFYRTLPSVEVVARVPRIEARTDGAMLTRKFLDNIRKVVDFDCRDPGLAHREFEDRYRFARKLSRMVLPSAEGHDEFLGCDSQLEYVGRLRERLTASG